MAVTTPSIIAPVDTVTGLSLDAELGFLFSDFAGAGNHAEGQLRISTVIGMTALVWDTLLRPSDGLVMGDAWARVHPADFVVSGTLTYYCDYRRRSDVPETSSFSAVITITFAAPKLSMADWRAAQ
jgi:hypothetical protein